jgi:hypothetical protein
VPGYNHYDTCTCGWCLKRRAAVSSPLEVPPPDFVRRVVESRAYAMTCPQCGQSPIFFYRAENGGRAFFDSLGIPWPKHPCFDCPPEPEPARAKLWSSLDGHPGKSVLPKGQATSHWVEVADVLALPSGQWLWLVNVLEADVVIPMLATQEGDDRWGWLSSRSPAGHFSFDPSLNGKPVVLFGPAFDCWSLDAWESRTGPSNILVTLARDLGQNRFDHFGGAGALVFLRPAWIEALSAYSPALEARSEEAMFEVLALVGHQARGLLDRRTEATVAALGRRLRTASTAAEFAEAYDLLLEELAF